jgi:hypothetical protein
VTVTMCKVSLEDQWTTYGASMSAHWFLCAAKRSSCTFSSHYCISRTNLPIYSDWKLNFCKLFGLSWSDNVSRCSRARSPDPAQHAIGFILHQPHHCSCATFFCRAVSMKVCCGYWVYCPEWVLPLLCSLDSCNLDHQLGTPGCADWGVSVCVVTSNQLLMHCEQRIKKSRRQRRYAADGTSAKAPLGLTLSLGVRVQQLVRRPDCSDTLQASSLQHREATQRCRHGACQIVSAVSLVDDACQVHSTYNGGPMCVSITEVNTATCLMRLRFDCFAVPTSTPANRWLVSMQAASKWWSLSA